MNNVAKFALVSGLAIGLGTVAHIPRADAQVTFSVGIAPPPPRYVRVPAVRPGSRWARGYWRWTGFRYVWVRGHWYRPRPGYVYYGPHWVHDDGRWFFREGRWHAHYGYDRYPVYRYRHRDRDDWHDRDGWRDRRAWHERHEWRERHERHEDHDWRDGDHHHRDEDHHRGMESGFHGHRDDRARYRVREHGDGHGHAHRDDHHDHHDHH